MKRNENIDTLRGLGILSMIFVHITSWFLNDRSAFFIWNWGQFAVPVFVFCSTYLFFVKKQSLQQDGFTIYALKRLKRLLSPYYFFLIFYYLIFLIKDASRIKFQDVLQSVTLTSPGQEINWAILLFVYMFLITLLLIISWRKSKVIFIIFSFLALSSSLLLLSFSWPFNYKLIMWLPWSLIILFSWFFAKYERRGWSYAFIIVITFIIFIITRAYLAGFGKSLVFIANKYPPNLYYLSYGMLGTAFIYWLSTKNVFKPFEKVINYFSLHSYNIFFIHLWLIIAFVNFMNIKIFTWWQFFAIILGLTILIQSLINKARFNRGG